MCLIIKVVVYTIIAQIISWILGTAAAVILGILGSNTMVHSIYGFDRLLTVDSNYLVKDHLECCQEGMG